MYFKETSLDVLIPINTTGIPIPGGSPLLRVDLRFLFVLSGIVLFFSGQKARPPKALSRNYLGPERYLCSISNWWDESLISRIGDIRILKCRATFEDVTSEKTVRYSEVPYDRWVKSLTGTGFNELVGWNRNHFDRLIHFLYGLLITYPFREIFLRVSRARGFWTYLFPLLAVISASTTFELLEWAAAVAFGGDLGTAFLGTQGDDWDAQKDMLLAAVGSMISTIIIASVNYVLDRDFSREWADSLNVKRREPLGEVELARLLAEKSASKRRRKR